MNNSRGYYFGAYRVEAEQYLGADFSRRCFIFPGQGAAFPGMFKKQYADFKIIRDKFKQADSLAKELALPKISNYILQTEGLKEETLPIVRNLALFTLEVALHEILVDQKIIPQIVTGHSFGEYAALVAAGIISFEEMFDIIYHRDLFCPKANEAGFMMAVNANEQSTKNILAKTEFYVSNLNSPGQTVISVSPAALDEIKRLLEKSKVKHKVLSNVPQPYHSPYLDRAKDKIERYLKAKRLELKKPQIPLFSSVTKKVIDQKNFKEEDIRYILTNQMVIPVNFIRQISTIYDRRCFNFIELSASDIWTGFVRDILTGRPVKTGSAINLLKIQKPNAPKIIRQKNNKLFSLISKTIGKITGYEIEKISWEDRYQEDLGIDSIKKAEILLKVLKESKIDPGDDFNTSGFGSIKETMAYLEGAGRRAASKRVPKAAVKKEARFERCISVWEIAPLKNYIFETAGKTAFLLIHFKDLLSNHEKSLDKIESFLKEKGRGERRNIIIFSDNSKSNFNNISVDEFRQSVILKIIPAFKFFRRLLRTIKQESFNLALVSIGQRSFYAAGCASFLKSVKKESPGIFFKHIHFNQNNNLKELVDLVEKEMRDSSGADILYQDGRRFKAVLKRAAETKSADLNEKSVVVAIGGAKGIAFSLIKNISRQYRPTIYLIGKSPSNNEVVRANVAELKKINPEIYYETLDAVDIEALNKCFSKINDKHQKIDLVINGAGVVKIGFLKDKTNEEINYEFGNKVYPAFNVLHLALKYRPKRIINFSSVISKYGSAGQSIYTSANALISRLTEEAGLILKNLGSSAVTIHWPPWDNTGMTKDPGVAQKLKEYGVSLLKTDQADRLFPFDIISAGREPVYYLAEPDPFLYGFSLNDFQAHQVLIGKISDPFALSVAGLAFKKTFDLAEDIYLRDHKIMGVCSVPAAVGISMFLRLAEMCYGEVSVLKNIVIHNPVLVKEEPLACRLEAENKGKAITLSLRSNILHFSGLAENSPAKKMGRFALKEAKQEVLIRSIYSDYYFKNGLYLGPVFQSLDRVFLDGNEKPFVRIDNSKLRPLFGLAPYDKLIHWIDASFQALGAIGLKHNRQLIPIKISQLNIFLPDKLSNYFYIIPSVGNFKSDEARGKAVVVNEEGEAVLEMTGVILKVINQYGENRLETVKYQKNK
ncbi:MAG: SDR family NAD(P)-dependent oxidoreductase [Candidatus Portnoybacteria bacterium]|nr:SDR family NAD(P)-dependent oxidoreductase [Candidatus Portnoybacteria bacterium]MDD4982896.1 SDR family NAD(P)-dependent oxidoreductase [Candidatus Portnoybacteria bacterium]